MREVFLQWCKQSERKIIDVTQFNEFFEWLEKNDYKIIKVNNFLYNGWDCELSPTGYCDYEQEDGGYDEDCCRYCGQPDERK